MGGHHPEGQIMEIENGGDEQKTEKNGGIF
jgi:hypothetical protein